MRKFLFLGLFVGLVVIAGSCATNGWNDSNKGVAVRDCVNAGVEPNTRLTGITESECACWVEKIAQRWSYENYTSNLDTDTAMSTEADAMLNACR